MGYPALGERGSGCMSAASGPLTAKTHVSRILMKLGARDRVQLVVMAYESHIVER